MNSAASTSEFLAVERDSLARRVNGLHDTVRADGLFMPSLAARLQPMALGLVRRLHSSCCNDEARLARIATGLRHARR